MSPGLRKPAVKILETVDTPILEDILAEQACPLLSAILRASEEKPVPKPVALPDVELGDLRRFAEVDRWDGRRLRMEVMREQRRMADFEREMFEFQWRQQMNMRYVEEPYRPPVEIQPWGTAQFEYSYEPLPAAPEGSVHICPVCGKVGADMGAVCYAEGKIGVQCLGAL